MRPFAVYFELYLLYCLTNSKTHKSSPFVCYYVLNKIFSFLSFTSRSLEGEKFFCMYVAAKAQGTNLTAKYKNSKTLEVFQGE